MGGDEDDDEGQGEHPAEGNGKQGRPFAGAEVQSQPDGNEDPETGYHDPDLLEGSSGREPGHLPFVDEHRLSLSYISDCRVGGG